MVNQMKLEGYHGTPNGPFCKFDTFPAFITPDKNAALAYALNQCERDDYNPVVLSVAVEFKNPRVVFNDELLSMLGEDDGSIDWLSFDNMAFRFESEGYDGIILKGVSDFIGMCDGKRIEAIYDQYVLFSNKNVEIN